MEFIDGKFLGHPFAALDSSSAFQAYQFHNHLTRLRANTPRIPKKHRCLERFSDSIFVIMLFLCL